MNKQLIRTARVSKGFTLIELLVVIAIIGLLAAVVLASVGGARQKGVDAAIKQQLNAARAQGELYATSNNNSYSGVCLALASAAAPGFASITANLLSESNRGGVVNSATVTSAGGSASSWQNVTCHDTSSGWALDAPLSASTASAPSLWCVDSTGSSKGTAGTLTAAVGNISC